jgi:hypothetical protein
MFDPGNPPQTPPGGQNGPPILVFEPSKVFSRLRGVSLG